MYKAESPLPVWGCRELSAQTGHHRHLRRLHAVLLHVLFREHANIPLQHLKGHLPHLRHQLFVLTGPFL